jgi:hypothetical protein
MPVQASNRLFKLLYRTDRLEVYPYAYRLEVYRTDRSGVYPYATGWLSYRTGWLSYRTGWLSYRTGCPTRSVADCITEIFVLALSVSRTAKYLLATGTAEETSLPEERRTFRTDSSHSCIISIMNSSTCVLYLVY